MNGLLQDFRYAVRQLRRSPGFTAVAVLALALGIASTTSIFSVVDGVLLHPLPYSESDRIVSLAQTARSNGALWFDSSPANYQDWAAQNHVFSVMAAGRDWQCNLAAGDRPERIRATMTTASFFALFGTKPRLGRSLLAEDEQPGHDHVVVLGHNLWQRRYGANPALVGQNITLDSQPYTVIGVMPPGFSPDEYGELWVPSPWGVPTHPLVPGQDPRQMRDRNYLDVWARLRPGVTLQQASAEMQAIAGRLEKQYPDANDDVGVRLMRMRDSRVGEIRPVLFVLLAAVAFVLLIGCANVANLLLARAAMRAREVSIRAAMGASRVRLIRQLLTESILLALCGGALGVLLAAWAVPTLLSLSPSDITNFNDIGLNHEVLGFSVGLSLLSGILFGLAPAWHASGMDLNRSLREGERGSSGGRGRTRSALVISEVGLSLVLLIGAGLLVKSFSRLMHVDPGFNPERLLVFRVGLPSSADPAQQDAFYKQVVDRLQALPGVQSAGAVSRLPMVGGNSSRSFAIPGSDRKDYLADIQVSTPGYFHTMGIPLLQGRNFTAEDDGATVQVGVVNQVFVEKFLPAQDPIGKFLTNFGPTSERLEIVGVVGNVRHRALESSPHPAIYLPFGQAHWPSAFMVVRTLISDPAALTSAAQNAVWSVDKNVPLDRVRTMEQVIADSALRRKFTMLLLTIFAGLAMLLAGIGLYGVMAYSVSQRTREIGIRMALGAQRHDVLGLVVKQGMSLAGLGVLVGIAVSLGLTRLIAGLLFGVSATDPLTFLLVALGLAGVALLANYVPARRAAKVDPMVALRCE